MGGGSFFLLDALELGGGVCAQKGRQGFLSHAKQAPRHVCPQASSGTIILEGVARAAGAGLHSESLYESSALPCSGLGDL